MLGLAAATTRAMNKYVNPYPQASMMYCTTAVPTALNVARVRLNDEETLPGFMG